MATPVGAKRWLRPLIGLGLVIGACAAHLLVRPDLMVVEHVVFEGQDRAGAGELRHLADLRNGTTVWGVDLDAVARGVARHPWIRAAEAELRWPDTVVVRVDERRPVALLHTDEGLLYVDDEGAPFLRAGAAGYDYPHLTGIDLDLEQVHPDLPRLALRDALWLVDTLDARALVPRDGISEVSFSRTRGWTVHVDRTRLVFGHGDLERQLQRLGTLVREGGVDLAVPTYIDLAPSTVAIVRPLGGGEG